MFDRKKIMETAMELLESVSVSEDTVNSLIASQNFACRNLSMYLSDSEQKPAEPEIAELIKSTITEAVNYKRCLQGMRNSVDKLTSYIRYPSLSYYWV